MFSETARGLSDHVSGYDSGAVFDGATGLSGLSSKDLVSLKIYSNPLPSRPTLPYSDQIP